MSTGAKNPFRPGVGLRPTFLAGRDDAIQRFSSVLRRSPDIPGNVRLTGLRGVGKTVLLQRFQEEADGLDFATFLVEIEPRHCTDQGFLDLLTSQVSALEARLSRRARVKQAVSNIAQSARKAVTVSWEGLEVGLGGDVDEATRGIAEVLRGGIKAAHANGKRGLVVFLDEAQALVDDKSFNGHHPLSSLVAAVSTLQKQLAPVSLVLCGLPTLAVNLLGARTYSERMFQGIQVDSLKPPDAVRALVEPMSGGPISATPDLVSRVIHDVEGYPYFIQLWGAELWEAVHDAEGTLITVETLGLIESRIHERLDIDFYEPRVESLTPAEQDLLIASAECKYPPLVVSDLNSASTKSNENVNVLLGRLVKANVLYRPRKGQYLYTAPRFREYLLRRSSTL